MKFLLVVLALAVVVSGLTEVEYTSSFEAFKTQFGKSYAPQEESYRYGVYKKNLDFVNSWDEQEKGFKVAINKFADLTVEEFSSIYLGMNVTRQYVKRNTRPTTDVAGNDVDWRTKGAVTPVKDQGQCGSCWSFSATGSMEAAYFFKTGNLVSLSEQNLVDCSNAEGNAGCNGGLMDDAFKYVIKNKGIDTEESYPYTARDGQCKFNAANIGATISSFTDVASGDEDALKNAVDGRPVSIAIDASHSSFQMYHSGVYYESKCSPTQLDHGVLAVGYGTEGQSDYWIVKNSWGASWGMQGYINMARNRNNNCGVATAASWPTA